MAVPQTKDELLGAINKSYGKLRAELDRVPPDKCLDRSLEGHAAGTMMSVHDLVAYLVGWNVLVLKWYRGREAGIDIDFPETGYHWNELGRLAQKFYGDYSGLPFPMLLQRLDEAKSEIAALIGHHDNASLYQTPWYGKWPLGRMIQFNTSSPYDNACKRLRAWRKAAEPARCND